MFDFCYVFVLIRMAISPPPPFAMEEEKEEDDGAGSSLLKLHENSHVLPKSTTRAFFDNDAFNFIS